MIDPGLDGRVAIVTGTDLSLGIGAATARALAKHGVSLLLTHQHREPKDLLDQLAKTGVRAESMLVDLADVRSVPAIFDRAEASLGPVQILVNNAAASGSDSFKPDAEGTRDWARREQRTITAATHDYIFAVNTRAVALLMAEFAKRAAASGSGWGRIVNLSTDGAHRFPGEVSYGASKLAIEAYSRAAAVELASLGITVNIVSPGPTQTGWIPEDQENDIARAIPLGRVGRPEDIADSVLFFCSVQAGWLTGQTLYAGGGHRM
jgi:3-oxoacyl-[acyl-carrier protein] reductase